MKQFCSKLLIGIIRLYQLCISPLIFSCRFYPSCSSYAIDAIKEYGVIKGLLAAFIRICKCNPLHPGGFDPVNKQINNKSKF